MDLALTEDQKLIAEAAADYLAEACDSAAMRRAAESDDGFDRRLWQGMVEQGWCGIQAPESGNGMGLGWVELALLQEQLGRRLACVPYFDSVVLAATLLRAVGGPGAALLAEVAGGKCVATVADDPSSAQVRPQAADGWLLDGHWPQLSVAGWADQLLVVARDPDGQLMLLAVPATSLEIRPLRTVDATQRSASVRATAVALPAEACLSRGDELVAALQRVRDLGAVALAAEQVGVAQQCLDLTLAYIGQRMQFGRSIASFQAVKHRCAKMLVAIEVARSAVYGAATLADGGADAAILAFHAAQALTEAVEAARYCAQESIQLHGGVGYTWEYDPQLYFKRAQAARQRLGAPRWWRARVAAQLLDDVA